MSNYFRNNRPGVVRVSIPAATLTASVGISAQSDVEIPFRTDDLDLVTGEDDAGSGNLLNWAEYRVPGTTAVTHLERMVYPDGSSSDEKKVGGSFKKAKGQAG